MTKFREHIDISDDHKALVALAAAALENARDLVKDAQTLAAAQRWPRVLFLSQIAGEELGKVVMCVSAAVEAAHGSFDRKKFQRRYRHHLSKLKNIMGVENLFLSDEFEREMAELNEAANDYETGKMLSLYSGQFAGDDKHDATVLLPRETIPEKMARDALGMAEGRLKLIEETSGRWLSSLGELSPEDIKEKVEELSKRIGIDLNAQFLGGCRN
jgi:AbiV family abortive infection protein